MSTILSNGEFIVEFEKDLVGTCRHNDSLFLRHQTRPQGSNYSDYIKAQSCECNQRFLSLWVYNENLTRSIFNGTNCQHQVQKDNVRSRRPGGTLDRFVLCPRCSQQSSCICELPFLPTTWSTLILSSRAQVVPFVRL